MRFTLAQLRKFSMPYHCSEKLDLSEQLNHFENIISVSVCEIDYEIKERGIDTYLVTMHIEMDMILECSVTLQEVPYHITADAEELFSTDDQYDDVFIIENQTLDTQEAVIMTILIQKPMKVTVDGVSCEENDDFNEGDHINPAFAKLKDLL